jgi:hypothetical protein
MILLSLRLLKIGHRMGQLTDKVMNIQRRQFGDFIFQLQRVQKIARRL